MPQTEGVVNVLGKLRAQMVDYQSAKGIEKDKKYSFVEVVRELCQLAYQAVLTIVSMLCNLVPFLDGFVLFARFSADKLLEIFETPDITNKMIKSLIFFGELLVLMLLLYLIISIIVLPILYFTFGIIRVVMSSVRVRK